MRTFFLCYINILPLKMLVVLIGQVLNYQDYSKQERNVEKSNNMRMIRELDYN